MLRTAVVIPAYRVEQQIAHVVAGIPASVDEIIVVNDCSPDNTAKVLESIKR